MSLLIVIFVNVIFIVFAVNDVSIVVIVVAIMSELQSFANPVCCKCIDVTYPGVTLSAVACIHVVVTIMPSQEVSTIRHQRFSSAGSFGQSKRHS